MSSAVRTNSLLLGAVAVEALALELTLICAAVGKF